MADRRMEALAARQHAVVSRDQARALGLGKEARLHLVRSGRWEISHRNVYRLVGSVRTARQDAMAAVLASGPGAVLSHTSAAGLLGLSGYRLQPLVVTIPRRRQSLPSVRLEQSLCMPAHHRRTVDGIPCTSIARTIFDLCGDVHAARAERTLDSALARRLVTVPAMWRVLDDLAVQGRKGVVMLRSLLTERGGRYVPPESELESRFVELVRRSGLEAPARQVDLGDADQWVGRFDFVWRDQMLVVEVDGAAAHDGLLDRRRDARRTTDLERRGWTVLRFRWRDVVESPAEVTGRLRRAFRGANVA